MDTSANSDEVEQAIREPAKRRIRRLEEKLRILEEAAQPGASIAAVARKHDLNANLLFGWRRLHRRGLLEAQRHASPPLLPVQITAPTLTPTRRARSQSVTEATPSSKRRSATAEPFVEIVLSEEIRIRLHGAAQHALLERVFGWLPRR
jgi:transposase